MAETIARPGAVTLVAVLALINGVLDIVSGTILLFQTSIAATAEEFGGASALITSAIVSILVGAIIIALGVGVLRGSDFARITITVFEVLSIGGSVFLAIAYPAGAIYEYFGVAISVIVLALLWTGRANAFFKAGT